MSSAQAKGKRDVTRKNAATKTKQAPKSPLRTATAAKSAEPPAPKPEQTFESTFNDPLCVMDKDNGLCTVNHWNDIPPNTPIIATHAGTTLDTTSTYAAKLQEGHKVKVKIATRT